jgi:hypothetical protein
VTVALVVVGLIAVLALALVLVLARRLRTLQERVNAFLPQIERGLPEAGTPLPAFTATTVTGGAVSQAELAEGERLVALLTTDCGSCLDQIGALQQIDRDRYRPFVVVIGAAEKRNPMVAALAEHATVVEENEHGPLAKAWDVHEFPAVLLLRDGYVQAAGHGVATALAGAAESAAAS